MIKRLLLICILLLSIVSVSSSDIILKAPSISAYSCQDTVVEQQTSQGTGRALRSTTATTKLGQTFLTTEAHYVCKVTLKLKTTATAPTGYVWVEIYGTSGGLPTGSPLQTSDSINCNTLTTSMADYTFTLAGYSLADATLYAIVIAGDYTIGTANYVNVGIATTNPYSDGLEYDYNGSIWSNPDSYYDFYFKVLK